MTHIKMILCDLDGTLLNDKKTISPYTRKIISTIRAKGILFGICTGRSLDAVKANLINWHLDDCLDVMIGFNGGVIEDLSLNIQRSDYPLEGRYLLEIINHFKDLPIRFCIYEGMHLYTLKLDEISLALAKSNRFKAFQIEDPKTFFQKAYQKLVLIHDPNDPLIMDQIKEHEKKLQSDHYHGFQTGPNLYEYVDPRISKIEGIKKVCDYHDISLKEVMCFGDAQNDVPMLQGCGLGVCMKNGDDNTKAISDLVTPLANNEDGVAHFIEEYLIKKGDIYE